MPKPLEKKVFANGMLALPPSDKALNLRSASAGSLTVIDTAKPCGLWKRSGGASEAMITSPSIDMRACMIFFLRSGGDGIDSGASSFLNISSILAPSTFS